MRIVPLILLAAAGCATTPVVRLHADSTQLAQLAPAAVQPLDERARVAQTELDRDAARGRERLDKAAGQLRQAREEPEAPQTAEVRRAKVERAEAELRWQQALVDVLTWRGAVANAATELSRAQLLSRSGRDVDVEPFTVQHAKLRTGFDRAVRHAASERARFEEAERRLNQAKEKYAKEHVGAQLASRTAPR